MKRHFLFQYSYFFFAKNEVLAKQIFAQQQLQDLKVFFSRNLQQKLLLLAASAFNGDDENIFILNVRDRYSLIKLFVKFPSFHEHFYSFSDSIFACSVNRCGMCL